MILLPQPLGSLGLRMCATVWAKALFLTMRTTSPSWAVLRGFCFSNCKQQGRPCHALHFHFPVSIPFPRNSSEQGPGQGRAGPGTSEELHRLSHHLSLSLWDRARRSPHRHGSRVSQSFSFPPTLSQGCEHPGNYPQIRTSQAKTRLTRKEWQPPEEDGETCSSTISCSTVHQMLTY